MYFGGTFFEKKAFYFYFILFYFIFLIEIIPCKVEQPLQGMELQEK